MVDTPLSAPDLHNLSVRVDKNEKRLDKLENVSHSFDKDMAVLKHQLDSLLEMVDGIGKTIRNSIVTVIVGALLWAITQMAI